MSEMNEKREQILSDLITGLTYRIRNNPNEQEAFFKNLDSEKYEYDGDLYKALDVLCSHIINAARDI